MVFKIMTFAQIIIFISGIVTGLIANFLYQRISIFFRGEPIDISSRALDDKFNWKSDEQGRKYFYIRNPDFFISISDGSDVLAERYKKFPDRDHNYIHYITLKFKEANLFSWNFMSLDGGRLFLPVPRTEYSSEHAKEDEIYEFYDLNSLEIKIFEIIGTANLLGRENSKQDDLEEVAKILNVIITKK